jgi:hypothetical protein
MSSPATYYKEYRNRLGFSTQNAAREFLAAKDVEPQIDFQYIEALNVRIADVIRKLNTVVTPVAQVKDLDGFLERQLSMPFRKMRDNNIISRMNNQGRRPEEVLFSWLRGYVAAEYFCPAISRIFDVEITSILHVGEDDLNNIELFRRGPRADLEINRGGQRIRLEVQSGFQGTNDIKHHKVQEAHRAFEQEGIHTVAAHFDLYNGQAAFVQLEKVPLEHNPDFVTRAQMEGQLVLQINPNYFKWRFLDPLPTFADLEFSIS